MPDYPWLEFRPWLAIDDELYLLDHSASYPVLRRVVRKADDNPVYQRLIRPQHPLKVVARPSAVVHMLVYPVEPQLKTAQFDQGPAAQEQGGVVGELSSSSRAIPRCCSPKKNTVMGTFDAGTQCRQLQVGHGYI